MSAKHSMNGYTPKMPTGEFALGDAVAICKLLEPELAKHGFHVALTGGTLYGEGGRKDIDLVFYRIRNNPKFPQDFVSTSARRNAVNKYLRDDLGMILLGSYGFVHKWQKGSLKLDIMYPDEPHIPSDYYTDPKG